MRNIFAIALTVFVAIPISGATGYILKGDPAPLTVKQTVERDLLVREDGDTEEWLFVVTKGPLKGQTAEAGYVAQFMTKKDLKAAGATAGKYIVLECSLWTTSGDIAVSTDPEVVNHCRQRPVTKKAVLEHFETLGIAPPAS